MKNWDEVKRASTKQILAWAEEQEWVRAMALTGWRPGLVLGSGANASEGGAEVRPRWGEEGTEMSHVTMDCDSAPFAAKPK